MKASFISILLSIAKRFSSIVCPAIEALSITELPEAIKGKENVATIF